MATTAPLERRRDGPRPAHRLSRQRVYPLSRGRLVYWRPDSQARVIARPIVLDGAELSEGELTGILPLMFTDDSPRMETPNLDLLERLIEAGVAPKTGSGRPNGPAGGVVRYPGVGRIAGRGCYESERGPGK